MRVLAAAVLAMVVALQAGCDRSAEPAKQLFGFFTVRNQATHM